jgi:hypothetical protein
MRKTTIYLSDEQTAYIKGRARETASSEAEVIRLAIDHLAVSQPVARKRPKSIGIAPDDTVTGRNFEEWLAANWERDW